MTPVRENLIRLMVNCQLGYPENGMNMPPEAECGELFANWLTAGLDNDTSEPINTILGLCQNSNKVDDIWLVAQEYINGCQ